MPLTSASLYKNVYGSALSNALTTSYATTAQSTAFTNAINAVAERSSKANILVSLLMNPHMVTSLHFTQIACYGLDSVYTIHNGEIMQIAEKGATSYIPPLNQNRYVEECAEAAMQHILKEENMCVAKLIQHTILAQNKNNTLLVTKDEISNATIRALYIRSAEIGYPTFRYLVNRCIISRLDIVPHPNVTGHFSLRDDPTIDIALFESDSAILITNIPDEPVGYIGRSDTDTNVLTNYATNSQQYMVATNTFYSVHDTTKLVGALDVTKVFEETL